MIFKSFFSPVTKRHVERRVLPTHPLHLFRIIQDVDAYLQFLPLCSYSRILQRHPPKNNNHDKNYHPHHHNNNKINSIHNNSASSFEATLTVGLPPLFQETYVSHVTVVPESLLVETKSIQSQNFDSLRSRWKLDYYNHHHHNNNNNNAFSQWQQHEPLSTTTYQCLVDFQVEMTVSDPMIVATLDRVLEQVAGRQVDAFARRCQEIPMPADLLLLLQQQQQQQEALNQPHDKQ